MDLLMHVTIEERAWRCGSLDCDQILRSNAKTRPLCSKPNSHFQVTIKINNYQGQGQDKETVLEMQYP